MTGFSVIWKWHSIVGPNVDISLRNTAYKCRFRVGFIVALGAVGSRGFGRRVIDGAPEGGSRRTRASAVGRRLACPNEGAPLGDRDRGGHRGRGRGGLGPRHEPDDQVVTNRLRVGQGELESLGRDITVLGPAPPSGVTADTIARMAVTNA
jgi:hypothetical protein